MRFTEEVQLVQEEMNRVLRFLKWQVGDWRRIVAQDDVEQEMQEGYRAYALRQADIRIRLHNCFAETWKNVNGYAQGLKLALTKVETVYHRRLRIIDPVAFVRIES